MNENLISEATLQALYGELNGLYFENILPPCRIVWSRRLTRAAGNIEVRRKVINLSVPLLIESYRGDSLFAPQFVICGVVCDSQQSALREILKHEMIHLVAARTRFAQRSHGRVSSQSAGHRAAKNAPCH